jgi:recombination protein RecA
MSRPTLNTTDTAYFKQQPPPTLLPSGCTLFDCALGGGYPFGRIVNIVGDRATSKTLLAIEACANFAHKYKQGDIYYCEAEAAFDETYAESIGMPVQQVQWIDGVTTVEDFYDNLNKILDKRKPDVPGILVLDSLDALSDRAEAERGISDSSFGAAKAKKLSELFRRMIQKIEKHQLLVIIISQIRDNIGTLFGKRYSRSGGRALDFYASQIIYLAQIKTLKKTISKVSRPIGIIVKAKLEKNKIGMPYREVEFTVRFGYGIDDVAASVNWLEEIGVLREVEYFASNKSLSSLLSSLDRIEDRQYNDIRRQLAKRVKAKWREIERSFAPSRKKYSNGRTTD